ncbi:hypothetical protein [Afipia clevelandensis]|uniref:Uncharacterized protein n=1 Tax=Afipia clevelandensis ATCC 49720 TaxID=883079 RepID=K8NZA8_9BRAD|nr:hypothetical protein [Afipia clevelandensis]EKS35667.1 hypothetical protein HMPREF9696_01879 [Afipia clevelandensis ATCC 49720]
MTEAAAFRSSHGQNLVHPAEAHHLNALTVEQDQLALRLVDPPRPDLFQRCVELGFLLHHGSGVANGLIGGKYVILADGIKLPSKRLAYTRGPDHRPMLDPLMVSIDISNVRFS